MDTSTSSSAFNHWRCDLLSFVDSRWTDGGKRFYSKKKKKKEHKKKQIERPQYVLAKQSGQENNPQEERTNIVPCWADRLDIHWPLDMRNRFCIGRCGGTKLDKGGNGSNGGGEGCENVGIVEWEELTEDDELEEKAKEDAEGDNTEKGEDETEVDLDNPFQNTPEQKNIKKANTRQQ